VSSSHLTSERISLKFPLRDPGVSSLTPKRSLPSASATLTASNFSSLKVSIRTIRLTDLSMISLNDRAVSTVSR